MTVTSTSNNWNAADRANRGNSADVAEGRERDLLSRVTHTHTQRDNAGELLEEERLSSRRVSVGRKTIGADLWNLLSQT